MGGALGRRGIIAIPPQQQLAGSSCSSKEIAQFQNAAERPDVVALEIAEGSAPHGALAGMVAGFFPEPDKKGMSGGTVGIIAGAATGLAAWDFRWPDSANVHSQSIVIHAAEDDHF